MMIDPDRRARLEAECALLESQPPPTGAGAHGFVLIHVSDLRALLGSNVGIKVP